MTSMSHGERVYEEKDERGLPDWQVCVLYPYVTWNVSLILEDSSTRPYFI